MKTNQNALQPIIIIIKSPPSHLSFLSESILIIFIVHVMTEKPCQHVWLDSAFASQNL